MAVAILVDKLVRAGVVGRVDVNALDLASVLPLEQPEGLIIFGVDEEAIGRFVEVLKGREKPVFEVLPQVGRVHH